MGAHRCTTELPASTRLRRITPPRCTLGSREAVSAAHQVSTAHRACTADTLVGRWVTPAVTWAAATRVATAAATDNSVRCIDKPVARARVNDSLARATGL